MRVVILSLLLVACSASRTVVTEAPEPEARWAHPVVQLMVSTDMSPECRAAVYAAGVFLRELGVPLEATWVEEDHPAISLEPRYGEVAVHAGVPSIPHAAAETFVWRNGPSIIRAEVVLGVCDPWIVAHELLHTQGLEDTVSAEQLMHYSTQYRQWGVPEELRQWVAR